MKIENLLEGRKHGSRVGVRREKDNGGQRKKWEKLGQFGQVRERERKEVSGTHLMVTWLPSVGGHISQMQTRASD